MDLNCWTRCSPRKTDGNKGVAGLIDNIVLPTCCRPLKTSGNLRQHSVVTLLSTPKTTLGVPYRTPVLPGRRLVIRKPVAGRT